MRTPSAFEARRSFQLRLTLLVLCAFLRSCSSINISHLFIERTPFIHLHARMHPLPSRIQTGTFLSISTMHTRHPAPRLSAYRSALLTFVPPLCANVTTRLVCYREPSIRIPLWAGGAPCRIVCVDAGNWCCTWERVVDVRHGCSRWMDKR
ncbi:hypothetical protein BJ912DRAFT_987638 [Pholiota molesta]|nr:hypothetical protein BJ912DRAFT_987638 [Pholiota molesta]